MSLHSGWNVTIGGHRLCVREYDQSLYGIYLAHLYDGIQRIAGNLTHLLTLDISQWIFKTKEMVIAESLRGIQGTDYNPYRNLRLVGTIHFFNIEEHGGLEELEVLRTLNVLEVIDISVDASNADFTTLRHASDILFGSESLFPALIEERHPFLHQVLLSTRHVHWTRPQKSETALLMEKRQIWTPRPVPYLQYWDILCGKLDEV
ncbi:hypothetical protein M408DRAFT_312321 [Serendipita vermifera MAFF 305830]|uniref:Uncharacterized protein n=1 Tax=Serendipita vermifera MAFF 305830 TaxID=933852 RepID=A0A0C2WK07_SERVB|nr:hypothetical protein M408DRAFT_312321 [Serendipita vermifera MAFF 305830]